jgi:hypothetical protein
LVFIIAGVSLYMPLAVADIASARENGIRSLPGIGYGVVVSLIPLFIANAVMTGNPFTSPKMRPPYRPTSGAAGSASEGGINSNVPWT